MAGHQRLFAQTERFFEESSMLDAAEAEQRFLPLLTALMAEQGFEMVQRVRPDPAATDYAGTATPGGKQEGRIGVEYKHYERDRPAGRRAVEQVVTLAQRANLSRVLLISRLGFTPEAVDLAVQYPVAVELLAPDDLLALARSVDMAADEPEPQIAALIRRLSEEMAKVVAENPDELDHLEWRDLERMMTAVLDGVGFDAELTPASKDGGKDIILTLRTKSGPKTYIVELKHWRSGKRVGENCVREFVNVVGREQRHGGLFLSTHGFSDGAFESLTEIERTAVKFGGKPKVVNLCRSFVKVGARLWSPDDQGLANLLLADTIAM
jgi:restriction system protein